MTPDEKERMITLCKRIEKEKHPQKFIELVTQLNNLLDGKSQRLNSPFPTNFQSDTPPRSAPPGSQPPAFDTHPRKL